MKYFKSIFFVALFIVWQFIIQYECFALNWTFDMNNALETAGKLNSPVMIDFFTDWCGWCKKLDKNTYTDSRVENMLKNFVCLKIDGDKQRDLVRKYNINGYPTIVFLDSSGNIIETVVGFRDADSFVKILENVLTKTINNVKKIPENIKKIPEKIPVKKETYNEPVQTDKFIYDGYIKSSFSSVIAQVKYQGKSYLLENGSQIEDYIVEDVNMKRIILKHGKSRVIVKYNK